MSITMTYKCDRCSAEDTDNKSVDLKFVGIGIKTPSYSSCYLERHFNLQDANRRGMEMCKKCRLELGIEPKAELKTDPPQNYPSFEEMIREMIREEISS